MKTNIDANSTSHNFPTPQSPTSTPPPPNLVSGPRLSNRQRPEITVLPDGRRFQGDRELFLETDYDEEGDFRKKEDKSYSATKGIGEQQKNYEKSKPRISEKNEKNIRKSVVKEIFIEEKPTLSTQIIVEFTSAIANGDLDKIKRFLIQYPTIIIATEHSGVCVLLRAIHAQRSDIAELLVDNKASLDYQDENGRTALMLAIGHGDTPLALKLIRRGANIHLTDKNNLTALLHAADKKSSDITKLLIEQGANIEHADAEGRTPIIAASKSGAKEIVVFLIKKGAEINAKTEKNTTALMCAAWKGNLGIVEALIHEKANINLKNFIGFNALMYAAEEDNVHVAEFLLANGAEINATSNNGKTALMIAATNKKFNNFLRESSHQIDEIYSRGFNSATNLEADLGTKTVNFLIKNKAEINAINNFGASALFASLWVGNAATTISLLNANADINMVDEHGNTPLIKSLKTDKVLIAENLINCGADIHAQNKWQEPAIVIAVIRGFYGIVKKLLEKNASPDWADSKGYTLLFYALKCGHREIVKLFLESGVQVNRPFPNATTPLILACEKNDTDSVKLLIAFGAKDTWVDQRGCTAIFRAAHHGNAQIAELLIQNGSNIHHRNVNNFNPLEIACDRGSLEVVRVLLKGFHEIDLERPFFSSALHLAVSADQINVIEFFIMKAGRIHANNTLIWKCVQMLAAKGYVIALKTVLYKMLPIRLDQITLFIQDSYQSTIRQAILGGNYDTVDFLLTESPLINLINASDSSLLVTAIEFGHTKIVARLLELGVSIVKNKNNQQVFSELESALSRDKPDSLMIDLLLDEDYKTRYRSELWTDKLLNEIKQKAVKPLVSADDPAGSRKLWEDFILYMSVDCGFSYALAVAVANSVENFSSVYAITENSNTTLSDGQLKMIFLRSILSAPQLHSLTNQTTLREDVLYDNAALVPATARRLTEQTIPLASWLLQNAELHVERQEQDLYKFIKALSPSHTLSEIETAAQNAGWHPFLVIFLCNSWHSLEGEKSLANFINILDARINHPEFTDLIESLESDNSRHFVIQQLGTLTRWLDELSN